MSDHDNDSTPPVLPQQPQYQPRPSGAGRWVFMFLFFTLAGLLLMGGWFVSSIGEAMDSLAAPTDLYTETIVRSGDTEQRIAVVPVTGIITSYGLSPEHNMVTRIKKQLFITLNLFTIAIWDLWKMFRRYPPSCYSW